MFDENLLLLEREAMERDNEKMENFINSYKYTELDIDKSKEYGK